MNVRTQKWLRCFECDSRTSNIHWHHVIPVIMGGTKCIPLCEKCHSIIHDSNLKISNLIKMGLQKAKESGKILGRPRGTRRTSDDFLEKHADIIQCLENGLSVRKTGKVVKKGYSTVQRVKKKFRELKKI
jgi:hypothetical protein